MNSIEYKCTGAAFRDLKNPYTGEPVDVVMTIREGREPRFSAPRTYSPVSPHEPGTEPDTCLWTGNKLSHTMDEDGKVWCLGGFDPHVPAPRNVFLRFMRMRGGVSDVEEAPDERVGAVPEHVQMPKGHETKILDESVSAAEDILKKSGFKTERKTSVRVSRKVRRTR